MAEQKYTRVVPKSFRFDFLGRAGTFAKISVGMFIGALLILAVRGLNLGLDFSGGHEILVEFTQPVEANDVRSQLNKILPGVDTSVQREEAVGDDPNRRA